MRKPQLDKAADSPAAADILGPIRAMLWDVHYAIIPAGASSGSGSNGDHFLKFVVSRFDPVVAVIPTDRSV